MIKINWSKIGMIVGAIVILGLVLFIVKLQWDANNKQDVLSKQMIEMKQLQDGIIRSQSKYVSKDDLNGFAKNIGLNLAVIRKDLDKFGAEVVGISTILASSTGHTGSGVPSTNTNPRPPDAPDPTDPEPTNPCGINGCYPDLYGYMNNSQMLGLAEHFLNGTEVPLGSVTFDAWKEKPWSFDIPQREYHVATVLGQDENGRHYIHNKFQIGVDGKKYDIEVGQAEFQEVYPEAEFRFDPHLNLGVDVGASIATKIDPNEPAVTAEVIPNLQVTLFSYGETKKNPEWTFLGLGLGYEAERQSLGIVVAPANYNVGKPIPLLDNFYVGPQVGIDIGGNVFVGAGVRVGL